MSHHKIEQKTTTADKVAEFIAKNRVALWISLAALVVLIVVFAVVDSNMEKKVDMYSNKAIELQDDFQAWFSAAEDEKEAVEKEFLDKIASVTDTDKSNILVEKALFLRGQLYLQKEEWKLASEDFQRIADSSPDSYLASVSLYNAAGAVENSGDLEKALELLVRISENYRGVSPILPEALFSVGRLNEALDKKEAAVEAYEDLAESFPSSSWTNLAKTRIISLKASGVSQ